MPVKPAYIKELGREIRERYPEITDGDFSKNKKVVNEVTNIESKAVRNRVAGFITGKENASQEQEIEEV